MYLELWSQSYLQANHGNIDIVETDGGQVELSLLNKTTLSEKLASDAISSTSTVINKETVTWKPAFSEISI